MIVGILHHGIVVSDIEAATAWYTKALGLEVVRRQRGENAYTPLLVGVPGAVIEVAQLRVPTNSPRLSTHDIELIQYIEGGTEGPIPAVSQVGAAHLAFIVSDISEMHARAVDGGARIRNAPVQITEGANEGGWGCYLHDPDGNTLEFIQPSETRVESLLATLRSLQADDAE